MIKSPITGENDCTLVETFNSQEIKSLYYKEIGLDVARFFTNTPEFYVYQCNSSKFRFYSPDSLSGDGAFYAELQKKFGDGYYRPWKWEHSITFKVLKEGFKILEVGCGTGHFLSHLKEKNYSTSGIELNQKAVEVAQSKGLDVQNILIEDFSKHNIEKFDVVCSFQVLEHINDVKSYIENCLLCLKKGGKLIIGVPNNNPYLYKYDKFHVLNLPPHHSGLWDKNAFQKLDQYFDFELDFIKIEPLFDIRYQVVIYLRHKGFEGLSKMVNKIPNFANGILKSLFSHFFDGRNIVAVYTKK